LIRSNVRGHGRGRHGLPGVLACGGRWQIQGRVLSEHRQLKLAQLRARFDGQLLDQQRPPLLVGLERIRLATATVQGDHQLPAEPLAHRMLGDELLKLGAHDGVAPERELNIDPVFDGLDPERLEAARFQPRERLGLQVGQRPAAPQRQG